LRLGFQPAKAMKLGKRLSTLPHQFGGATTAISAEIRNLPHAGSDGAAVRRVRRCESQNGGTPHSSTAIG
jgi:hypothetical protein